MPFKELYWGGYEMATYKYLEPLDERPYHIGIGKDVPESSPRNFIYSYLTRKFPGSLGADKSQAALLVPALDMVQTKSTPVRF